MGKHTAEQQRPDDHFVVASYFESATWFAIFGNELHVCTQHAYVRVSIQKSNLLGKACWQHHIVGIHTRKLFATRQTQCLVERRCYSAVNIIASYNDARIVILPQNC